MMEIFFECQQCGEKVKAWSLLKRKIEWYENTVDWLDGTDTGVNWNDGDNTMVIL